MSLLTNKYFVVFGIPLILIFCGAIIKKLTRGRSISPTQELEDWFLGIELIFSAFTSAVFKIIEIIGSAHGQPASPTKNLSPIAIEKINQYFMFLVFSFIALIIIMFIHQRYIDWNKKLQTILLGIIGNILGAIALVAFYSI